MRHIYSVCKISRDISHITVLLSRLEGGTQTTNDRMKENKDKQNKKIKFYIHMQILTPALRTFHS